MGGAKRRAAHLLQWRLGYFPGFAQIGERLGGFDLAYHPWQDPLIGEVLTVGQPRSNVLWWKALR